jgi:hypothetical protein
MKNGSCPEVGSGPPAAGGHMTFPRAIAGTAQTTVTMATFIHTFISRSFHDKRIA